MAATFAPAPGIACRYVLSVGVHRRLDHGVDATVGLATDPALDGVTGHYFDGRRESRPNPQAGDAAARRRLRELSDRLAGLALRPG
ncbi:MAG: hypothetical protein ACRDIL_06340 [Candidatus Limnocylindrales bacterium]